MLFLSNGLAIVVHVSTTFGIAHISKAGLIEGLGLVRRTIFSIFDFSPPQPICSPPRAQKQSSGHA
jgi:hypothetical protein